MNEDTIRDFNRDGAVCLRQFLNAEEIAILKEGIEFNLSSLSPRAKIASRHDDPGYFVEDFCTWQNNPFYQRIIFGTNLGVAAAQIMQSQSVRLYHDHLLVKEPGTRQVTPWHQDQPYYNIEGKQNCSFWIPVDPVSRSSTLEFIAGSHLGPWLMPRTFLDNQAKWFPEGSLQELPPIEDARARYPIIGWEIEPGDVVCFHMLTLHMARGVEWGHRRRVFSVRFLGDDITHAPRAWPTSPDFPGLTAEIPAGASMDHPLFPCLTV
ncbi:TPA: phytanoyl-CoA dioxygenase [Legionella pneumophila]|nr:phytanoyl-CoA dioxygenase [Legionella pneumophila]HAT8866775.1 phytanoyl-CoA dioxygenase [Legionella pneumophila subsp. pneumophila]HAT8641769.1 phytanoyl-CoA dioxygenase [Legionella pneumophila]HAT8888282.1 phytanoyl-CoA dioxygenase [Legionella pneumophila subsp. pneumophila]HAT8931878.1 phytanoyl-CoA dioxygenase [Legionella pneumophila subsp. pneumophila]